MAETETPLQDSRSLHELAVDAHNDLTKLATGLAHAGAAPQAVAQITQMGDIIGQITKVLGAGPVGSEPGQPASGHPVPSGQAPQEQAEQQPQPEQGTPAPAPGPAAQPAGVPTQSSHHALHAATVGLHAAMLASKAAQAQQSGR
jgi:hypothetical protein